MLTVIVLVCAMGQDPRDCQPPTARAVHYVSRNATPFQCQTAQSEFEANGIYAGEDEYLKIVCTHAP